MAKLRQVEVLVGQGQTQADAIRVSGVIEQTYYCWRQAYGGMGTEQVRELKRLQKENERLCRAMSDLTLDKLILAEAASRIRPPEESSASPRPRLADTPDPAYARTKRTRFDERLAGCCY